MQRSSLIMMLVLSCWSAASAELRAQQPTQAWTPVNWSLFPESTDADGGDEDAEPPEDEEVEGPRGSRVGKPIETDRPDFTEASSLVPAGRVQLESGYTFFLDNNNGLRSIAHTFPEWLLRVGLSEYFELRLGWYYLVQSNFDRPTGMRETIEGGTDMYFGTKVKISEQHGWWPEWACNIQGTLPTGVRPFNAERVNAGFNQLYGWDVTERFGIGCSTGLNTAVEHTAELRSFPRPDRRHEFVDIIVESRDRHLVFNQSITSNYSFTEKLTGYFEWFVVAALQAETNFPEHYLDGGFTYKVTNDFQLDIRAGVGLNHTANDFFAGLGYSVRY